MTRMRVALLAPQYANPTGVGVYTRELVRHLQGLDPDAELLILCPGPDLDSVMSAAPPGTTVHRLPDRRLLFPAWHLAGAPVLESLAPPFDLVHVLTPSVRVPTRRPTVVTICDLAPRHLPWAYSLRARWFMARALAEFRRRGSHVVAISETVRADVLASLGLAPGRVTTTRLAVDTTRYRRVSDPARIRAVRERYDLPRRFFLFVGAITPRKNLVKLLDAYDLLVPRLDDPPDVVLAGPGRPAPDPAFARRWRAGPNRARIHVTTPIAADDLPAVYSAAETLVYPSLHEGFGLPVLEAMACGLPVVCSARTALHEVAGDAALYVSGGDAAELADALIRVHVDASLRKRLAAAGRARVDGFSWRRCAEETLAVYRAALRDQGPAPVSRRG